MLKTLRNYSIMSILFLGSLFGTSHPAPGQWGISAEFLYLKPSVDDTYYVIDSPVTTDFPNGKRENNDFSFEPGFRVGGVYSFCDCNREVSVSYTRLSSKNNTHTDGDFLWATQGRADFASSFENYTGTARSDLDLLYQRVDALLAQQVYNCCGLNLCLQGGLEYAFLRLQEDFAYSIVQGVSGTVHQLSKTWGIGPQLGFALNYDLYETCGCMPGKFSVNFLGSGSILASQSNTQQDNVLSEALILDVSDENTWRLVPALHARVGLNYDFNFEACGCCYGSSIEIGYELSSYLRGLGRTTFVDDVADGLSFNNYHNFDLQGLYVSAQFNF